VGVAAEISAAYLSRRARCFLLVQQVPAHGPEYNGEGARLHEERRSRNHLAAGVRQGERDSLAKPPEPTFIGDFPAIGGLIMTEVTMEPKSKIAAGYAAKVADFAAASADLKNETAHHATTLAAAYGAFAAGYVAAAAAANQSGTTVPFPLLPLPARASALSAFDVLTLPQTAEYLQLPEEVVRREAEAGRLVGQNVVGEWRFIRESIISWLHPPRSVSAKLDITTPAIPESPEEQDAFWQSILAFRDEIDRATGHGKYAPE
jgi:hypothetical protein